MHYKTRANVYMVLGRGVVGSCFSVRYCSYLGGGGFHVLVNLLVALVHECNHLKSVRKQLMIINL